MEGDVLFAPPRSAPWSMPHDITIKQEGERMALDFATRRFLEMMDGYRNKMGQDGNDG